MTVDDLFTVLLSLLPVIKFEDTSNAQDNKCRYMIGTREFNIMIKSNCVLVRVGGGFATIKDIIR